MMLLVIYFAEYDKLPAKYALLGCHLGNIFQLDVSLQKKWSFLIHDRCLKGKGNSIQFACVKVQEIPEVPVHFLLHGGI